MLVKFWSTVARLYDKSLQKVHGLENYSRSSEMARFDISVNTSFGDRSFSVAAPKICCESNKLHAICPNVGEFHTVKTCPGAMQWSLTDYELVILALRT